MKFISLVVADKENYHILQCPECKNNVLSLETFKDLLRSKIGGRVNQRILKKKLCGKYQY